MASPASGVQLRSLTDLSFLQVPAKSKSASRAASAKARREKVLLEAGGAAPPGSPPEAQSETAGPRSTSAEETADADSGGPTGKEDGEAPKKSRGRRRRAVGGSAGEQTEPQPERKGPGRKKKVSSREELRSRKTSFHSFLSLQRLGPPPATASQAAAATSEQEPGSSRDAAAPAPQPRPAPEGLDMSSGPRELTPPPVTTVTRHQSR